MTMGHVASSRGNSQCAVGQNEQVRGSTAWKGEGVLTHNHMDIGDIQASPRKTIGAVSKTPIENRGPLLKHRSAPSPQVPEPRASYPREKTNARVFFLASQFFLDSWFWYREFLFILLNKSRRTDPPTPAGSGWERP